eukprot:6181354-Pleurochrysis_carterae.AAC.2
MQERGWQPAKQSSTSGRKSWNSRSCKAVRTSWCPGRGVGRAGGEQARSESAVTARGSSVLGAFRHSGSSFLGCFAPGMARRLWERKCCERIASKMARTQ